MRLLQSVGWCKTYNWMSQEDVVLKDVVVKLQLMYIHVIDEYVMFSVIFLLISSFNFVDVMTFIFRFTPSLKM